MYSDKSMKLPERICTYCGEIYLHRPNRTRTSCEPCYNSYLKYREKLWKKKNKGRTNNQQTMKRFGEAVAPWMDDHEAALIDQIYQKCPEGYEVDHIIPLKNSMVCGLHTIYNLQYLTKEENASKGNKFITYVPMKVESR